MEIDKKMVNFEVLFDILFMGYRQKDRDIIIRCCLPQIFFGRIFLFSKTTDTKFSIVKLIAVPKGPQPACSNSDGNKSHFSGCKIIALE